MHQPFAEPRRSIYYQYQVHQPWLASRNPGEQSHPIVIVGTGPVGLTTAGQDGVLVPRFHSQHVLRHCKTCTTLSDHPHAGHFDWLSPWPASLAQTVAATQVRGGLPNPDFSTEERHKAFEQIAQFFLSRMK